MYRDGLVCDRKIVKTGMPRCDMLINQREEKYCQLRREYRLSNDVKIMLYAPTFRGGSQSKNRSVNLEEYVADWGICSLICINCRFRWHLIMTS